MRPDQAACALDKATPEGIKAREIPQGGAFLQRRAGRGMGAHLAFTAEAVGEHVGYCQINPVTCGYVDRVAD